MIHRTKIDDAFVENWVPLDDEWEISAPPVSDRAHRLLEGQTFVTARLTYGDALAVAQREGAQLPTPDQIQQLHDMAGRGEALELEAFTGTPRAETTLEHSIRHDVNMRQQIASAGWNGRIPLANWGKSWTHGAPKGRAHLMGWWVPNLALYTPPPGQAGHRSGPGFVQPRPAPGSQGAHGAQDQHDDGTTTLLVRRRRPAGISPGIVDAVSEAVEVVADAASAFVGLEPADDAMALPEALLAAARADLGVCEQGGKNRGPEVDAWLRAVGVEPPGNWCAATVAKWIRDAVAATGRQAPIQGSPGAKATMAQLQAAKRWSAKAAGVVRPGFIVVWHRGAPGAWTGHVGICESVVEGGMVTIEGNSGPMGDRVARMSRPFSDPNLLGVGTIGDSL